MKPKNSTKPVRIALGLFLLGIIVIPNVLSRGHQSLARTTQTSTQATQTNDKGASEASLVRQFLDASQKLRAADLTPEARAQLTQELAQKRAQLRDLRRQTRVANGILPFGPRQSGGSKKAATTTADGQKLQNAQSCAGCKFVWKQILLDVGDAKFMSEVQAAFEKNCQNAQKATVYYGVCEDMYDDMYGMTDDYMVNPRDAEAICAKAGFCSTGT
jgi:hypothetical protein